MGLVEQIKSHHIITEQEIPKNIEIQEIKGTNEYEDSLTSVRQSLVLLKNNNNALPVNDIRSRIEHIVLVG